MSLRSLFSISRNFLRESLRQNMSLVNPPSIWVSISHEASRHIRPPPKLYYKLMTFLRFRLPNGFFFFFFCYADDRWQSRIFEARVRGAFGRGESAYFFFSFSTRDTCITRRGGHCATITRRNIRGRAPAILRAIGTT